MQLGMVGLGRMGSNLVRRLLPARHECVVYDVNADTVKELAGEGATGTGSLEELVAALNTLRAVWVMVHAGHITEQAVTEPGERMDAGDTIIDGGNSYYRDGIARAAMAKEAIHYVDLGTSGAVWGLERGYSLMIGGEDEVVQRLGPLLAAIAPGVDAAPRTLGRSGEPSSAEQGYLHCGSNGAGHFVKMVHNGIEYGGMAAYAEGLNTLKHASAGNVTREADAETAPLEHPADYPYDLNLTDVTEAWRCGSVIASWLLDLTASALFASPELQDFPRRVSDSGEGRWTAIARSRRGSRRPCC